MGDRPVLLVHGLATSAQRTWRETGWIDLLADLGKEVIAPDLLGHGDAPKPHDPVAYERLEDLVLEALPDQPVDAVGFSLGARVLLVLAGRHPERFGKLVLAGVGANLFSRHEGASAAMAAAIEGGAGAGDAAAGDEVVAGHFARLARDGGGDPLAVAACMRREPPPITDEGLARVTHETLVVLGDADFVGPADPLLERLTNARLVTLRGVDHFATPKSMAFLDAALDFLA